MPLKKLVSFLKMTADQWIDDFYHVPIRADSVETVRIQVLCGLDESDRELEYWLRQQRDIPINPPAPTKAKDFLDKQRSAVNEVEMCLKDANSRNRDLKLLQILLELKDSNGEYDFEKRLGRRNMWGLGDLFIALETPVDAEIYTTDRHYEVLCRAVRRSLYARYLPRKSLGVGASSRETHAEEGEFNPGDTG